jgi:hypothetical protein
MSGPQAPGAGACGPDVCTCGSSVVLHDRHICICTWQHSYCSACGAMLDLCLRDEPGPDYRW